MMRQRQRSMLNSSQQSIFFTTEQIGPQDKPLLSRHNHSNAFHLWMLAEDVSQRILPRGGHPRSQPLKVAVDPSDPQIEQLIGEALSLTDPFGSGYYGDLAYALDDLMKSCVSTLLTFAEATYEIDYLSDPQTNQTIAFTLRAIPQQSIFRQRGKIKQYIPVAIAQAHQLQRPWVVLDPENILTFTLPASMAREGKEMLTYLAEPGNISWLADISSLPGHDPLYIPYQPGKQIPTGSEILAAATRTIGWDVRGAFNNRMLNFYGWQRQLRFERFLIEIRTALLETINEGIARAGRKLGFQGQIKVEGLPTVAEVAEAEDRLRNGAASFPEIIKLFRYY